MQRSIVTFVNPDVENAKITLSFEYNEEKKTLDYNIDLGENKDKELDFSGYLATCFLNQLQAQAKVDNEK